MNYQSMLNLKVHYVENILDFVMLCTFYFEVYLLLKYEKVYKGNYKAALNSKTSYV